VHFMVVFVTMSFADPEDPNFRNFLLNIIITPNWLLGMIGWLANVAVVIVVAIVGTRTLARDRVMGGLEFILSKSIPPWGYVAARTAAPVGVALILLFLPMLSFTLLIEATVDDLPNASRRLLWGAVAAAAVTSLLLGVLGAGLGSVMSQPRRAVVLWLLVAWAPLPLYPLARYGFEADWWWLVGPLALARATTGTFVREEFPGDVAWLGWLTVAIVVALSLLIVRWRVREVVR
jgi:hypothetical protein